MQIKSLNAALFEGPEDEEEEYLVTNNLIADAQIQRFRQYEKDNSENNSENILYWIEQMSPSEKNRLREMLRNTKSGRETK